jgi:murein DD-endopeptidase MepM/ murein hydrolase activator NlpD
MENNSQRANRILYTVVVAVLCVVAIVIGIVAAANRTTKPPVTEPPVTDPSGTNPNPDGGGDKPTGDTKPTEYLCPISGTVSQKHVVDDLIYSETMGDWRTHAGMDIAASLGTTVSASADGTVREVFEDAMMGTCVSVEHEGGVITVYKNLSATLADGIKAGASVKSGQAIGTVGETAISELADEPHLHFEMTVNGEVVDPLDYLSEESKEASLTFDEEDVYED